MTQLNRHIKLTTTLRLLLNSSLSFLVVEGKKEDMFLFSPFKKNNFLIEIIFSYTLIYKYVATFTSSQFD